MFGLSVIIAVLALASGQYQPVAQQNVLKEARHLQAMQQPHLPKDTNVLAETQRFLHRFAELKALADAAPDPPRQNQQQHHQQQQQQPAQQVHHAPIQHPQYTHNLHHQPIHHVQRPAQHHPVQHHPAQPAHVNQVAHSNPQPQYNGPVMVPVVNQHGIVVNPNKYPGPLADTMPANVHG